MCTDYVGVFIWCRKKIKWVPCRSSDLVGVIKIFSAVLQNPENGKIARKILPIVNKAKSDEIQSKNSPTRSRIDFLLDKYRIISDQQLDKLRQSSHTKHI